MEKCLIVSRRLPVGMDRESGRLRLRPDFGETLAGMPAHPPIWYGGWVGICDPRTCGPEPEQLPEELGGVPVPFPGREPYRRYGRFCERTLWPLLHGFTQYARYHEPDWAAYREINERFRDTILEILPADGALWIHDYPLLLLPSLVRRERPRAAIGLFLHAPFPPFETLRQLPWRRELLEGLAGADLVGFQTYDYTRNFLESVQRLAGAEPSLGQVELAGRVLRADAFPLGIDYERYAVSAGNPRVRALAGQIREKLGGRRIILSVERLDYTKGLLQRLEGFERLLASHPRHQERVTLLLVGLPAPSRDPRDRRLRKILEERIGSINGRFNTMDWTPIRYLRRLPSLEQILAFCQAAEVCLVSPLIEGMSLLAKGFVAAHEGRPGVLVLSERSGAAAELSEAVIVNPTHAAEVAEGLRQALEMPVEEQVRRNRIMSRRLQRYNLRRWAYEFLTSLGEIKRMQGWLEKRRLSPEAEAEMRRSFRSGRRRLLLVDGDNLSLYPVALSGLAAGLEALQGGSRGTEAVVASGRDREWLEASFPCPGLDLIAEHGAWVRRGGGQWECLEPADESWKGEIRRILRRHRDRTPGSWVEEKTFSLCWHYPRVEPGLAQVRVSELRDLLARLNASLSFIEGNKVLEIRRSGTTKSAAVFRWFLNRAEPYDFVLAIGGDRTAEDLFEVLPPGAYSLRVGPGLTRARGTLESWGAARDLLLRLRPPGPPLSGTFPPGNYR